MIGQTGIIDSINFGLNDLDLEFVSTNASKAKSKLNPERSLIRYQIIEILTRIALTRFFTSMSIIRWHHKNSIRSSS